MMQAHIFLFRVKSIACWLFGHEQKLILGYGVDDGRVGFLFCGRCKKILKKGDKVRGRGIV